MGSKNTIYLVSTRTLKCSTHEKTLPASGLVVTLTTLCANRTEQIGPLR